MQKKLMNSWVEKLWTDSEGHRTLCLPESKFISDTLRILQTLSCLIQYLIQEIFNLLRNLLYTAFAISKASP